MAQILEFFWLFGPPDVPYVVIQFDSDELRRGGVSRVAQTRKIIQLSSIARGKQEVIDILEVNLKEKDYVLLQVIFFSCPFVVLQLLKPDVRTFQKLAVFFEMSCILFIPIEPRGNTAI